MSVNSKSVIDPVDQQKTLKKHPFVLHTRIVNSVGGGPEKTILNSPRYLRDLGYDSACLYLYPENDTGIQVIQKRAISAGAEIILMVDGTGIKKDSVRELVELCRRRNVAIWHAHDFKTNVLGLLVRRRFPMKLVTTAHGWCITGWKSWLYATAGRICLPFYDATIAVSRELYVDACRWALGSKKVHHIENAIDVEYYSRSLSVREARGKVAEALDVLEPGPGEFLVVSLGRMAKEKAYHDLIAAVSTLAERHVNVRVWVGGVGPLETELKDLVRAASLQDRFLFLGNIEDSRSFLQAADLFVLSSVTEGLPNVLLEAMALEVPIVSTNVGGIPRLVENLESGLLVKPNCPEQLADAIQSMVDDEAMRCSMVAKARLRIQNDYCFRRRMSDVANVYDRCLEAWLPNE
ncbi:glycosyltransferase family 4 protein [Rhodopirellula sallentina]|uniref:Glycosyl transferase, group 1 family protein n=1 Tax=Rhodopirellula sallentina SM41 TaxID=1263870 RepID=M5U6L8_9BACT|nr:glycosyltransferase family 4 protein [Rhodopirellula sallentina]EMI56914.1 glycosyl transferase, group 1 family protein [Rhodopirellula sallentina SM41]